MGDNEGSNPPSKRYNTRPKTKSSFVALEDKYSAYIVDTSPKVGKRSRNSISADYAEYQRYVHPQMLPRTVQHNQISQEYGYRNIQGYQMAGEPMNTMAFRGRMINTGYNNMYQPSHGSTMAPNMNIMYKNHQYGMHMNYQGAQMASAMVPQPQNVRVVNQMVYPRDASPYGIPNEHFNANVNMPMRMNQGYNVPHHSFVPHAAQQGYVGTNYNPNLQFPRPTQPDHATNAMDTSNVAQGFGVQNVLYHQRATPLKRDVENKVEFSPKPEQEKHIQRAPEADEIKSYFKAVDVILKDLSDDSKLERYEGSSFGCVSIVDEFKLTDPYRMVNIEYAITQQLYSEITQYLDSISKSYVQLPLNVPQNRRNGNRAGNRAQNQKILTADDGNGELDDNTSSEPTADKVNEIDLEFTNNNIKLKHERKICPITIDSYKQLSLNEARSLMSLLKDSNAVKANPVAKNRVKIIINSHDDTNYNYWVYLPEDSNNEYVLKHQFGSFVANDFMNKRVPLYTNVDFGKTDPSFLFGGSANRKVTKLSHVYGQVSRSYDLFLANLNGNISLGLSKIISESEKDIGKAIHTLSIGYNTIINSFISYITDSVSKCSHCVQYVVKEFDLSYMNLNILFSGYCNSMYDVFNELYDFSSIAYSKILKRYKRWVAVEVVDMDKCMKLMSYPNWELYFYNVTYVLTIESIKFSRISLCVIQFLSLIYVPYCCHVFITTPKSDPYYNNYTVKDWIFTYLVFSFRRYGSIIESYYMMIVLTSYFIDNINRGKLVSGMTKVELIGYIDYSCWLIKLSNDKIKKFRDVIGRKNILRCKESMTRKLSSLSLKSLITLDKLTMKIYLDTIIMKQARFLILLRELSKKMLYDAVDECKSKGIHYIKLDDERIGIDITDSVSECYQDVNRCISDILSGKCIPSDSNIEFKIKCIEFTDCLLNNVSRFSSRVRSNVKAKYKKYISVMVDSSTCVQLMNSAKWDVYFSNFVFLLTIESIRFSVVSVWMIQMLSFIIRGNKYSIQYNYDKFDYETSNDCFLRIKNLISDIDNLFWLRSFECNSHMYLNMFTNQMVYNRFYINTNPSSLISKILENEHYCEMFNSINDYFINTRNDLYSFFSNRCSGLFFYDDLDDNKKHQPINLRSHYINR
nr:hypothetical protein MACL_00003023 [Theileria orientalis]